MAQAEAEEGRIFSSYARRGGRDLVIGLAFSAIMPGVQAVRPEVF